MGLFCLVTYRALELLWYSPWSAYITFTTETEFGMSKATVGSFLFSRVALLLEYILLNITIFLLIVKVMEWTGDYLLLAFFFGTLIVELFVIWLFPRVIHPLTAATSPLPEKHKRLLEELEVFCDRVGFYLRDIWQEQTYNNSLHANASVSSDQIFIGKMMLK